MATGKRSSRRLQRKSGSSKPRANRHPRGRATRAKRPHDAVTIRPAGVDDEAAVLALLEELFDPPGIQAPGYTPERGRAGFKYAVHDRDADLLLAVEDDRVVGLASVYADILSIRYGPRCWLQDLIVAASHRSRGIGAQLMDAATDWARERGCTHLELSSGEGRKDAHRFYLSQGMSQSYNFTRAIE